MQTSVGGRQGVEEVPSPAYVAFSDLPVPLFDIGVTFSAGLPLIWRLDVLFVLFCARYTYCAGNDLWNSPGFGGSFISGTARQKRTAGLGRSIRGTPWNHGGNISACAGKALSRLGNEKNSNVLGRWVWSIKKVVVDYDCRHLKSATDHILIGRFRNIC